MSTNTVAAQAMSDDNLLMNPAFERAEEVIPPPGWVLYGGVDEGRKLTVVSRGEERALLIEDNVSIPRGNDGEIGLYQSVGVQPGEEYEITARIKAVPGRSTRGAYLQLRFYPSNTFHVQEIIVEDTDNFKEVKLKGVAPDDTESARVYIYTLADPTPKFLVRDVSLAIVQSSEREAATFYVSPDGDDSQPGTKEAPWRTLDRAVKDVIPGDTVMFYPGVYHGVLRPTRSGTYESPITFKALERRTAQLVGEDNEAFAVRLRDVDHVRIEGFHIKPKSPHGRWLTIGNAKHIHVTDVLMEEARSAGIPFVVSEGDHVFIRDSVIRKFYSTNMARVSHSTHVVFEGNSITRTGHSPLQFYPEGNDYIVVRANVFHPAWGRAFEFFGPKHVLFEDNIVTNSFNGGWSASATAKIQGDPGIFRYNRVFRNWGGPIAANPFLDEWFRGVRIYNNVFDDNAHYGMSMYTGGPRVTDVVVTNNVFSRNDVEGIHRQIVLSGPTRPTSVGEDGAVPDPIPFRNNLIAAADNAFDRTLSYKGQNVTVETAETSVWQRIVTTDLFADNVVANPEYEGLEVYDHTPAAGSPLIDRGRFLARAMGSGEGRILSVDDASYFYDGFGIDGEIGDIVAVGSTDQIARVVHTDRDNNLLTLDRTVRWEDGVPVSFPWSGDAPDIGVYESGPVGRSSVQIIAEPFVVQPGEEVTLRAILHGIDDATEIRWQLGDGQVAYGRQLSHVYAKPYDYPIRVTVSTSTGEIYRGVGYVVVEEPRHAGQPLLHTTFNEDDEDWWWLWQSYRPSPAAWERVLDFETGEGYLRIYAESNDSILPAWVHPVNWDVDAHPYVYVRYRIQPGTPVALFLKTFVSVDSESRSHEGRVYIAGSAAAEPEPSEVVANHVLIDDGEWHEVTIDVREVRQRYPEVRMLEGMRFHAPNRSLAKPGDGYDLDEVMILPNCHRHCSE